MYVLPQILPQKSDSRYRKHWTKGFLKPHSGHSNQLLLCFRIIILRELACKRQMMDHTTKQKTALRMQIFNSSNSFLATFSTYQQQVLPLISILISKLDPDGETVPLSSCSSLVPLIIISRVPYRDLHKCVVVASHCISLVACCTSSVSQSPRS